MWQRVAAIQVTLRTTALRSRPSAISDPKIEPPPVIEMSVLGA
jgi:hypothetical protein